MQKILILMSATGGGHKASAQALKAGFELRFPGRFQIEIVDLLLDYLPPLIKELPKTYPYLANDAQWAWKLLWATGARPKSTRRFMQAVARLAQPNVVRLFRQQQPDLIISVHPLVHEMSFRALKRLRKQPPFATVITDLASAHPLWFYPRVDLCFIPTEPVYRYALQLGMQEAQLRLLGLPVRPVFAQASQPKTVLRQQLGMHPDLPAVLVMGGGDGIGAVAEIARQVASKLTGREGALGQIVVIAGRNRALLEGLSAQRWPIPAKVQGFVENVDQWMNACDCIVTKSGPGTIAEASCCGLPMILSGFIPGQEAGNAPYVVEHGAGAYETEPPAIAALIQRWFSTERAKLGQMAAQARALGRPNATVEIVEVIAGLLPPAPISYS